MKAGRRGPVRLTRPNPKRSAGVSFRRRARAPLGEDLGFRRTPRAPPAHSCREKAWHLCTSLWSKEHAGSRAGHHARGAPGATETGRVEAWKRPGRTQHRRITAAFNNMPAPDQVHLHCRFWTRPGEEAAAADLTKKNAHLPRMVNRTSAQAARPAQASAPTGIGGKTGASDRIPKRKQKG